MEDPVLIKFLVLKCVKKYFNWELLLRQGSLLNINALTIKVTNNCLCSKLSIFKTSWPILRVLLYCFRSSANRYDLGFSNELFFIIIAQVAVKLWPIKVGGWKKILCVSGFKYLVKRGSIVPAQAMMMKSSSFEGLICPGSAEPADLKLLS